MNKIKNIQVNGITWELKASFDYFGKPSIKLRSKDLFIELYKGQPLVDNKLNLSLEFVNVKSVQLDIRSNKLADVFLLSINGMIIELV